MTTSDEQTVHDLTEDPDPRAALPLHPWTALRPATGMLLGADDFEVLMGNPRGKHQLHNAWLHGGGVVWGLGVRRSGEWDLEVARGLAVDGHGRELRLDAPRCVSLQELLQSGHDPTCGTYEVELCLVLRFDACLDSPVPALVDPCDVTRESTDYSRVVERARLELVSGRPASPPRPHHRVRVLLGLDRVGEDDEAGEHALECRDDVAASPPAKRPRVLLRHFRCLAALDAADWRPQGDDCGPELFPVADAGVLLACVSLTLRDESGCPEIVDATLDSCRRPTVLPTTVLQDLVCALAPGVIGVGTTASPVGPQIDPAIAWSTDDDGRHVLHLRATAPLIAGSVRRAVRVSSLSDSAWIVEDLEAPPRYDAATSTILVTFADRPKNPHLRIVVRGTGTMPVYGADPVAPLAGVRGEDPGSGSQGRDAVLTVPNPFSEGSEAS